MAPERPPPQAFLRSLRTLFDLLDDRRRGFVPLREIESRWLRPGGEARDVGLPPGVLEGLRRAAPASGRLTFERFVRGLRASLRSPEQGADAEGQSAATKGGPGGGIRKLADQAQYESPSTRAAEGRRQLRDRRRHTITSGVDYSMMKQMKELEKEKDFLLQGLEMIKSMRDWYHQHIHALQERQKQLGSRRSRSDLFTEGTLSHLLPKLQELNRGLRELLCLSEKLSNPRFAMGNAPPSELTPSPPLVGSQQAINMLKEQNRLLTMEVTDKSERITQLEQEKSALIKQLFDARAQSHQDSNQLDSTFI